MSRLILAPLYGVLNILDRLEAITIHEDLVIHLEKLLLTLPENTLVQALRKISVVRDKEVSYEYGYFPTLSWHCGFVQTLGLRCLQLASVELFIPESSSEPSIQTLFALENLCFSDVVLHGAQLDQICDTPWNSLRHLTLERLIYPDGPFCLQQFLLLTPNLESLTFSLSEYSRRDVINYDFPLLESLQYLSLGRTKLDVGTISHLSWACPNLTHFVGSDIGMDYSDWLETVEGGMFPSLEILHLSNLNVVSWSHCSSETLSAACDRRQISIDITDSVVI
ncbi:hypothetical protein ABKN59_007759 [Abortiporus biennis]